jgi:hypothetical protein
MSTQWQSRVDDTRGAVVVLCPLSLPLILVCRWGEQAAAVRKAPRGGFSAELLRGVAAVCSTLQGVCDAPGEGGAAERREAEAAAEAAAAALLPGMRPCARGTVSFTGL